MDNSEKVTQKSIDEVDAKLTAYKEQYNQIELALKADPRNEALIKAKTDLLEVIKLTEDLLKVTRSKLNVIPSVSQKLEEEEDHDHQQESPLPEPLLQVGQKCMAIYHDDGLYYEAVVDSVPSKDHPYYAVTFVGYGNSSYVSPHEIAPISDQQSQDEEEKEETIEISKPVSTPQPIAVPKNLKILPTDSDAVRNMKRKRAKAIKSLNRSQQLDQERERGKNAWQSFQKKATSKSRTKRESIFKSPDSVDGKVGVTGSGRPLTESPSFNAIQLKRQFEEKKKRETETSKRRKSE